MVELDLAVKGGHQEKKDIAAKMVNKAKSVKMAKPVSLGPKEYEAKAVLR